MHITVGMTNLMLTGDTLTAHFHFFLCCGYLLHSEFLGSIPLVAHDSNPWKGPPMTCLPSIPSYCTVIWLFTVPRLHLQDVTFFHILLYSPNICLKALYLSVFIYLLFFP